MGFSLGFMTTPDGLACMSYEVVHTAEVPVTDLANVDAADSELSVRNVDELLDPDGLKVKLWHLAPGESMPYHAHAEQEEVYFVLDGTFELTIGRPPDPETAEAGSGTFVRVDPEDGRDYENVGDDSGVVLAIATPAVEGFRSRPRNDGAS